ncbi:hypothetical protein OG809_15690 [Kribbella soli]
MNGIVRTSTTSFDVVVGVALVVGGAVADGVAVGVAAVVGWLAIGDGDDVVVS